MTLPIHETVAFRRDVKRVLKRRKDMEKLYDIVAHLASDQDLDMRHKPHPLAGNWKPAWECHIEPDWLLIYRLCDDRVELMRTGTHSDLFKK